MKRLSTQEFRSRCQAIQRATRIFGEMTEGNITRAFQAYQEILAETDRVLQLDTKQHGERSPTFLDDIGRPPCPDCGADLMIRRVPENEEGIKAQFVCSNRACDLVLDSLQSMEDIVLDLMASARARKAKNDRPDKTT